MTTNHVFVAFVARLDRLRNAFAANISDVYGYNAAIVHDRLAQRFVEIALAPFAKAVSRQAGAEPVAPPLLDCGKCLWRMADDQVRVPFRQFAASYAEFLAHWGYGLALILAPRRTPAARPSTVVLDASDADLFDGTSDAAFVEFLRRGPIAPLNAGQAFLIATATQATSVDPRITYCRRPLLTLLRNARLGAAGRARLLVRHVMCFASFSVHVCASPVLSLLGRDFAYAAVARSLDDAELIDSVVMSCTGWTSQPLWMRALRATETHMVWYSQNVQPVRRLSDDVTSASPMLLMIGIDTHWVWTRAFGAYLQSNCRLAKRTVNVGPLLWRLPEHGRGDHRDYRIAIFDVPAVNDDIMLDLNGEATNYLSAANLTAFISGILEARTVLEARLNRRVSLCIKQKRRYTAQYAREYFDYIESLCDAGVISREDPKRNLHALIASADAVVAYPFTSPAYAAEWLHVPAVYFDPTGTLMRQDFSDRPASISFAGSVGRLVEAVLAFEEAGAGALR